MAPPRIKKPSRKDPQQTTKYSYVLGDHLRLVDQTNSNAKEKRSKYILAGGRRSADRDSADLVFRWESLSLREKDVTVLVCRGHTNEQIARLLNISVSSVKTYLRIVFLKIDAGNKVELRLKFHNFNFKHDLPYL
ncbi:MAG: helix-turn-helix transcriptional regulator [Chloroflexota bacterium]|nr:helix-turn-helix transcriptional regulator [Chloroflexota bacterium]